MALFGGIELPGRPDLDNIRKLDVLPIPQICRMQRVGVAIDKEWFQCLSSQLASRKEELRKDITSHIPPEALEDFCTSASDLDLNVESASQIATLLFKTLKIGQGQKLKRTKSGDRISTGKKQLETLKWQHPVIQKVLEYREASKLKSTYTDALPELARLHPRGTDCPVCGLRHVESHWRVHTSILTTRTDTGRLASKKPNLQNIPARTKLGREVRKGFVAEKGKTLVAVDYSQIELRLLAHAAQESNMIRIFQEGKDIHADTAMRAFDKTLEEVTSELGKLLCRAPCKNVNFGIVYGLQASGLFDLMAVTYATAGIGMPDWLTFEWCEGFIVQWFELYPEAREYFELQHYRARRYGIVWTWFGRVRRVPEVRSVHERVKAAGLRQAGNHPIQGTAGDVFKIGMARVEERFELLRSQGVEVEALLPIHDELLSEVDEEWADEVAPMVGYEMEQSLVNEEGVLECRVPVLTESKVMTQWQKG